jgi:hypothetical protein
VKESIRQVLQTSLDKKRAANRQKIVEADAEALMASYKRNSLWGI